MKAIIERDGKITLQAKGQAEIYLLNRFTTGVRVTTYSIGVASDEGWIEIEPDDQPMSRHDYALHQDMTGVRGDLDRLIQRIYDLENNIARFNKKE